MGLAQNGKRPIGPNPKELWDYKTLPIGAVQIGEDTDHIKTGVWRLIHPFFGIDTAPCNMNCPVGNDIRSFVHLTSYEDWRESLQVLRRENPFPAVCGRVCYHPCESACNRANFDEAISIHDLERGVADHFMDTDWQTAPIFDKRDEKIAIIGAGPSGLSCTYFALLLGYRVIIFEETPLIGGVLRTGIPEYRLPLSVLERELEVIRNLSPEILTSKALGRDVSIDDLKEFKAIFIGIGASTDLRLDIPGIKSRGVYSGLELLRWIRTNQKFYLGKRVAVVGGGNVAIDVARSALRLGATPILLYRRTKELMPCNPEEIKELEEERIEVSYLTQPIEIVDKNGVIKSLRCCKTVLDEEDDSGRKRPLPVKGSDFEIPIDSVVFAVGEVPDLSLLPRNIRVEQGTIIVNDQQATTEPRIYAGGDVVSQPWTVAHAIGAGKRAAFAIDLAIRQLKNHLNTGIYWHGFNNPPSLKTYLDCFRLGASAQHANKVVEYGDINTFYFKRRERIKTESLENSVRVVNFQEVNLGANPEQLREETSRCFQCGVCTECDNCFLFCPDAAIKWNDGRRAYEVDLEYCKGCGICSFECPHGHIKIEEDVNL